MRIVTIQMHAPYKLAACATLPNAKIIVDKWHIQRKPRKQQLGNLRGSDQSYVATRRASWHHVQQPPHAVVNGCPRIERAPCGTEKIAAMRRTSVVGIGELQQ
ncbi:transposase [Rhizobium sophoriradicis]|uniref:Transposase IS204/IS1001/IS1096/IS1165 DDE domain-containing protein n=1 Tax=Rhizobium sophoriradicis TaxID=1535245 RepID=A0A2A5KMG2_9HYPH|nr:hypothetical protein CPT34_26185 [Rhizobium sophoriradicis]